MFTVDIRLRNETSFTLLPLPADVILYSHSRLLRGENALYRIAKDVKVGGWQYAAVPAGDYHMKVKHHVCREKKKKKAKTTVRVPFPFVGKHQSSVVYKFSVWFRCL